MRIAFGLHLDGLNPAAPRNAAGDTALGPKGLLHVLETQLGLPTPDTHPSEAPFSYLQCLREASTPERFFHRSLVVDPVNVARTLLDWRAQWYEAGWDGTFPEDAPSRLADMTAVEAVARNRVPPNHGERLRRVAESLAERRTQIERVELHTPLEDLPHVWRQVLNALPYTLAPGLELAAAGATGSDLARVQQRLLSLVDHDEDRAEERESLRGDGSLIVVKSGSKDLSADAAAEFLLETGGIGRTLLVAEIDGIVLDNALERAGLPRCGFRHFTRFRSATQVLKLALALVWKPVDPHRILQFLLHSGGPLPGWVRWRLADAVAASPGIGGPVWIDAIKGIIRTLQKRDHAAESDVAAAESDVAAAESEAGAGESEIHTGEAKPACLRSDIAFWLEAERFDPEAGAPLAAILERTGRISVWASKHANTVEDEAEAAMFAAAHAQAEALLTELAGLRQSGVRRIPRLELQRRIDEVTTDSPDPSTYGEAARARSTTAAAAVTDSWPTVVWWNLAREPAAISYPWSRHELDALRASGVRLSAVDDIVRRRSREWLRPLCNAAERLVLIVHHDERGTHPLLTRIESLFDGLATVDIESVLLAGRLAASVGETPNTPRSGREKPRQASGLAARSSELSNTPADAIATDTAATDTGATGLSANLCESPNALGIRARPLPLRRLRALRRWWSLPADIDLAPRAVESYSSLARLCDYPHAWVLRYAARLRTGRAAAVMDGSRLWGNLGHRLFEEFFRTRTDWPTLQDDAVLAWVRSELPGLVEREGAVLLGRGRGVDRRRVAAALERALVRLLAHLRSAGAIRVTAEVAGNAPFEGRRLTGAIDLVAFCSDGKRAVLDVKWAGESYRGGLLADNRALQLATYAFLQKHWDGGDAWPASAFYILATGNVLAADAASFPDAVEHPSRDSGGLADLWDRLRVTCGWRWLQLEDGRIEVVTDLTAPLGQPNAPVGGLAPVSKGDPYDEFLPLAGWEDSR